MGYVDGDRQFAFLDSQGIAAIGSADTLRLFASTQASTFTLAMHGEASVYRCRNS